MTLPAAFLDRAIAHRCLHDTQAGRPENSWEALDAAIVAGFPVEIDLQLSRDGCAVVFHDYTLDRLTGECGPVSAYTATELAKIPLKEGKKTIPLFDDFCSYVANRVPVLVELKDQTGVLGDSDGRLEKAACDIVNRYSGIVAFMSFNPDMMRHCAKFSPDIARGLVTDAFRADDWPNVPKRRRMSLAQIPDYDRVGACFISHNHQESQPAVLSVLKARGAKILDWTVRSSSQEIAARKIAHNITFEGYLPN